MNTPTIGDKLNNGAIVLQCNQTCPGDIYVLCLFHQEFVSWLYNPEDGGCYHGRYHSSLGPALKEHRNRTEGL